MMKETVLDVLRYLFEQYMDEETEIHPDRETLYYDLVQAGFSNGRVNEALEWLEGLAEHQDSVDPSVYGNRAIRLYTAQECERLDAQARGFLLYLEQVGILDPPCRELVVERLMALKTEEIDLEELKWVVLVVLFNNPEWDEAYERMEDLMYYGFPSYIH